MATLSTSNPAAKRSRKAPPLEIGWREWARLPDLGVDLIKAKIDTGAKTSAIHAYEIRKTERNGAPWVAFLLHPVQKRRRPEVACFAPIADIRSIRSSNGGLQERIVIRTTLAMGARSWAIDLSLTNRDEMGYRMLVGRDALKATVIRPAKSFLLGGADAVAPAPSPGPSAAKT
ncbi:MAG: ATP-dependent zinc protease [Parvularculaceae bacterium]